MAYEYISIDIDEDLYNDLIELCQKEGTTLERVTEEFFRFCADERSRDKVKEMLGIE